MEHLNRIEIRGSVGNIRIQNVGGKTVARMTVATNLAYKAEDGSPIIETTWHNVTAWEGREIQNLDRICKGSKITVVGRIRQQRYIAADGEERSIYEVLANKISLIDSRESLNCEF